MSTINITGTGGIIEGNLGAANVNVNLDAALEFDGVNDLISVGNIGTHAQWTISFWAKKVGTGEDGLIDGNDASSSSFPYITANPSNFYVYYASGGGAANTSFAVDMSVWNHFAITYDAEATNNLKTYCNGVLKTTVDANNTSAPTTFTDFTIGDNANYGKWDGFMADVKTFNDDLAIEDIQILASKINVDPTLVSKTANLTGWWKVNDAGSTINDFVNETNDGTDHNGTLTGGDWRYNEYCVDVYDGSDTRTTGTFTVTQGKVEGKALSYLHNDATNDATISANAAGAIDDLTALTKGTVACWTRADNFTNSGDDHWIYSLSESNDDYFFVIHFDDASGSTARVRAALFENGSYQWELRTGREVVLDKWHHIAITQNGTEPVIYVDGVAPSSQAFLNSTDKTAWWDNLNGNADRNMMAGGLQYNNYAHQYEPDGDFRDFRFYNHGLSAEQASSLYSGSYNITPMHWIKCDEGSGTLTDSGTDTAWTVTNTNLTYVNGTLDLDGQLVVTANGTLSMPRGDLEMSIISSGLTSFEINCTDVTTQFIHNNGQFVCDASNTFEIDANGAAFYKVKPNTSGGNLRLIDNTIIEKELVSGTGASVLIGSGKTYTFGTATENADINHNVRASLGVSAPTITGASTLHPVNINIYDDMARDLDLNLADVNVTTALVHNRDKTITLTGDCEFDAVTVGSGDTLDLSGQRMVTSGLLTISGNNGLKNTTDGSTQDTVAHLICNGILASTTTHHASLSNVVYLADGGNAHKIEYFDFGTFVAIRAGAVDMGRYGPDSASMNVIAANTTNLQNWGRTGSVGNANSMNNLTIATGTTVLPESATLTVAGDFTTSGGLIGKSALNANDTHAAYGTATSYASSNMQSLTMSGWVKMNSDFSSQETNQAVMRQNDSLLMVRSDGKIYAGVELSKADNATFSYPDCFSAAGLVTANKWHHIALTWKASEGLKVYLDGKLVGEKNDATTGGDFTHLRRRDGTSSVVGGRDAGSSINSQLAGTVAQAARWQHTDASAAKSAAQIRTEMFQKASELSSTTGLYLWFQFDNGTGTTAIDSSPNTTNFTVGTIAKSAEAAWAGAGTFTEGSGDSGSTLKMTGTGSIITKNGDTFNKLWIASGTTTLKEIVDGDAAYTIKDDLTIAGTITSDSDEYIYLNSTFGSNSGALNFSGGTLTGLSQILNDSGVNLSIPAHTTKTWKTYSGATSTQAGDVTATVELEVQSGGTWNANGNTISCKEVDVNDGTLNLSNSTMSFYTQTSDELNLTSGSTLITGNTTLTGYSAALPTNIFCPDTGSAGNFEVVGDVSNFKMQGVSDLTVIGSVTDCVIADGNTTAIIRQWHHTLDTQQLLDADSAGDDDLRLTKPALDNALELMTK